MLLTIFIFGTIVGSFLNVAIFRYNTGRTVGGRSACMTCSKTLQWSNLIPVLSYVLQLGKCSYCKSKISFQYPLVEVLTGFVFMLVASATGFSWAMVFYLAVFSILIVIAVYDYKHKIIPDGLAFTLIALGALRLSYEYFAGFSGFGVDLWSALGLFVFFASLWFVSKGAWMGFGDAKLALGLGLILPYCENVSAIMLSFFAGSIYGIIAILVSKVCSSLCGKKFSFDHEIPFAPFMILGALAVFALHFDVLSLLTSGTIACVR